MAAYPTDSAAPVDGNSRVHLIHPDVMLDRRDERIPMPGGGGAILPTPVADPTIIMSPWLLAEPYTEGPMSSEMERLQADLPRRYRILRELDGAGMSRVYLAREELPERDVAVKVLDEGLSARVGRTRFVREVEVTSKLSHPHIVPIYAAGEAGATLYYVMPYIDGESLRDRIAREGQLPFSDALRITIQVADALQHAHDRGVVHRDIKPSNILLQSGFAVIADFGIARALDAAEQDLGITEAHAALGTPTYMSPEQAAGEVSLDGRTDQYALACVLFEMLAGHPPFRAGTARATLARHVTAPVPSVRIARNTVPAEVERCISRALAKDPDDRFDSVADFARALDMAPRAAESSWIARRTPAYPDVRRWGAHRVAATLIAIGALGLAWTAWSEPPRVVLAAGTYRDSVAVAPFENRTGDLTMEFLGRSIAEEISGHLASVPEIRVIGSYSVESLWDDRLGIRGLLDSLDIGHLIQGAYEMRGDQLALMVQQLDATGTIRASSVHSIALDGLDTLQGGLALAVADQFLEDLGLAARPDRETRSYGPARDAYLTGNSWLGQRTPEGFTRAIASFREAIGLDEGYAPAYAALSSAYALALYYKYDVGVPGYGLAAMALDAAERAIDLDDELSSGYSARGYIRAVLGVDVDGAEGDFARALELAPNRPDGPSWSARVLAMRGRTADAVAEATRARDLDPLQAGRRMGLATLAFQIGDLPLALEEAREAGRLEPSLAMARAIQGRALALMGRAEECLALRVVVYPVVDATCRYALGRREEARLRVADVEARIGDPSTMTPGFLDELAAEDLATYYGFVGDPVRAADWLRRAFDLSPNGVDVRVLGSELFAPVRGDPGFDLAVVEARELARIRVLAELERLRSGAPSTGDPGQ